MESKKEFDFAEWAKVIDDHPAFMKKLPDSQDGEMPEAFEALQAMKYCDDDDTPEGIANLFWKNLANCSILFLDRAKLFKEDGNKHFQYKKYRFAIEAYTKGIALRCCDKELNGILYGNRAASHVRLGNLRSAMRDCFLSRKFNPDNIKVIIRGKIFSYFCYVH